MCKLFELCPAKPREVVLFENTTKLISFNGVWRMEHVVLLLLYEFPISFVPGNGSLCITSLLFMTSNSFRISDQMSLWNIYLEG
jgi:hypothetical protein